MRKLFTVSAIACFLFFCTSPVVAQEDNTHTANNYNEDDMPQADTTVPAMPCTCNRIAFGIEAGLNISDYTYGAASDGTVTASNPIVGGRIGGIVDIHVHGIIYIQPGIFYAMTGASNTLYGNTWNVNTIEVPANLILKFPLHSSVRFFAGAGPFFGYNVSGASSDGNSLNIGTGRNDNLAPFDIGFGINAGIELANGWLFRLRYQQGFANLQPDPDVTTTTINSVSYGLQVGYIFGRKHCQGSQPPPAREERVWDQ